MSTREAVLRLIMLLKEYKKTLIIIIASLSISSGLNLCVPLLSRQIMDLGFIGGNKSLLVELVLLSMVIFIVDSLIDIVKEKKRVDIASKIQYSLSKQSFTHLMKLKADYFNNHNYAEIMSNVNVDVNKMSSIADSSVFFVVTQAFSMIGGIIGLFIIDYRMTLLVLVFIPVKFMIMKHFAKKQKILTDDFIIKNHKYARWFGDTVGGINEVKLFNILNKKTKEFDFNQKDIINKQKEMNLLVQWNGTVGVIMLQLLSSVLYIVGANLVFNFQLSVGSVFAFITYSSYVTGPISAILNIGYLLSGIIPSTKRYYEFMDLQEESDTGHIKEIAFGDLELRNVYFEFNNDKPVLTDISILFAQGSKTAVIGRNGSGKTTIINLLTRLYDPTKGKILLNGVEIANISLQAYRDMVSIVSQQIYLFNNTIRDNICLYKRVDDSVVLAACEDSGLGEFISEVSLDYVVGQNGSMLSGGQKQKIALARALIHDKPIIIFDEATSNTDAYSEQQINGLLHTRLKKKTVIVVTHKREILSEVDQIVVLQEGKVIDVGHYCNIIKTNDEIKMMMEKDNR